MYKNHAIFLVALLIFTTNLAFAHPDGCHKLHSCPPDSEDYTCGDTGYCSECPNNDFCQAGIPVTEKRTVIKEKPEDGHLAKPVPSWIKTTAGWWSSGTVSEAEFIDSLEFLIELEILEVPTDSLKQIKNHYILPQYSKTLDVPLVGTVDDFQSGYFVDLEIERPDQTFDNVRFIVGKVTDAATGAGYYTGVYVISSDYPVGVYKVTGKYLNKSIEPYEFTIVNEGQMIPDWIKNNAKWWSQGSISDYDFVSGIGYLINNGIIAD